ncbi:MAG: single-stranded-DNA-specific exonuclease RecJ [Bacteroidales bacterium]|jgi:single-stranded-DNA-specific exonuclease|nr:single-stranded-DNA-specific exonuclease RecJ [Bacteroidales bacterium]
MNKNWTLNQQYDNNLTLQLAHSLANGKYSSESREIKSYFIISQLLLQRGIRTFAEAKHFFRPSLFDLHSPFLMDDMSKAVERIGKAMERNEKILVYGDYDVDGTCAVALVYSYLKRIYTHNVDFYIPDRYHEGYGVSLQSIDWAINNGFSLIISLDCGIKAINQVEYAASKGIDFIICDHHIPDDQVPKAYAILDPKCPDSHYPYKELTGCGIGFKLVEALTRTRNENTVSLYEYLDLVTLSIGADVVPITDENRILAYYGLKQINTNPRQGIIALLACADVKPSLYRNTLFFKKEVTMTDLIFSISPRLNAAGRMESGETAVKVLIADTEKEATTIAKHIDKCNNKRRELDRLATDDALKIIADDRLSSVRHSNVLYSPEWHKGVIGIVASRVIEHYYKPTVVFTRSEDCLVGSARSISGFDIHSAIAQCSYLLKHFGGHKSAAGLTMAEENLAEFTEKFEQAVTGIMQQQKMIDVADTLNIDMEIGLDDIGERLMRMLKQFEPFGNQNPEPLFTTSRLVDTGFAKIVGSKHLKFEVIHPHISSQPIGAIGFSLAEKKNLINGKEFDICYNLTENEFNGTKSLQLNVKDIR